MSKWPSMNLRARRQRSRKGYATSDLWNLDAYLCQVLGSALIDLYRKGIVEYPDGMEDAAQKLLGWDGGDSMLDENAYDRAVMGMQWVTDNLGALWD